jgi:hypothetical protein
MWTNSSGAGDNGGIGGTVSVRSGGAFGARNGKGPSRGPSGSKPVSRILS